MSLRLRIEHGQDAGTTYRIPAAGVYTLGRTPQNSIRVLDMKVSKTHCELRVSGQDGDLRCQLHDPGSTHGCELNGQPVPKGKDVTMRPGDELRLGLTILRLLSAGDADRDAEPVAGRAVEGGGDEAGSKEAASTPTLPADDLVGKQLGGYQVEKKIGAGGMGGVYLAEQVSLHRKVALKVLNETFAADSAFVDQFVNEARAAGALNHPNVVQVYDVGNDKGRYFFSMEVMPGGSIEEKLRDSGIEWEEGLNYFIDAANALIFAKKREILHRDVKPDNLMISEDDSAKLCDLGLAKKSEVSDLMDQGIIGTPHFISPEAIRRKPDIDHRTDLYSLGCTFYRIFTGKNPYPAGTVKEILLGHLNKPVPRVNTLNRNVPRELDEVVAKLMAKDPEERVQSPEDLLRELDKIRTKYNLEAHGIKPASRTPLIVGGVLAAAAIGVAVFFATRDRDPGKPPVDPKVAEMRLEQKRQGVKLELEGFLTTTVRGSLTQLETRRIQGDLGTENYTDAKWTTLIKAYRENAKTWQAKRDDWTKAKEASDDKIIQGYYADYGTQLDEQIAKAKRIATQEIEAKIQELRDSELERKGARAKALSDAEAGIKGYAEKLKKLGDGSYADWITLEKTVRSDELPKLLDELLGRKIKSFQLLKEDKDLEPLLAKHGLKKRKDDLPRGFQVVQAAGKQIDRARTSVLEEIRKALGEQPTRKAYADATAIAQAFLDSLPAGFETEKNDAPLVVAALIRARDAVKGRSDRLAADLAELVQRLYRADRRVYFDLVRKLWNPETGTLQRFDFAQARASIDGAQSKLTIAEYKALITQWPPLVDALERLFQRIVAAEKSGGWVDDDFMGVDRKGRPKKMRIRDISGDGVKWDKDTVPFHRSSPRWLLENLFLFEDKPRMTSVDAIDQAGLGLLAELAGRYDHAKTFYARASSAEGPLGEAARARLARVPLEEQAAGKFFAVLGASRELDGWLAEFESMIAELEKDPDAFPQEAKERVETARLKRLKAMQDMSTNIAELNDEALATTMWASALREEMHPRAAYAGETITATADKPPRQPVKDTPKKDDAKKEDAPKKDADPKKGNGGAGDGE